MLDKIKLVLVSCCAPCSAGAIKQLADGDIAVVGINVHVPAEMVVPAGTQYEP